MGMHFGVLAARAPWERFLAELAKVAGEFEDRGVVASLEGYDPAVEDDGNVIVGGGDGESSFIVDTYMDLVGGDFDRLVALSGKLDSVVVACVGETVSGTFGLMVAKSGTLQRFYWNCASGISKPFERGEPLATEASSSLEDIDGQGLFDAMKSVGLDYQAWYGRGMKRAYLFKPRESDEKGPIDAEFSAHWERYQIEEDQVPSPTVATRRMADGTVGFDVVPGGPKKGLLARLVGMLFGN